MRIHLVRHGIAEPRRTGYPDAARALTEEGRLRFEEGVRGMKRLGLRFDQLFYSPLVRAAETAAMMEKLVEGKGAETPLLAKSPTRALLDLCKGADVALVGHQPWLGELLAWLCFGDMAKADALPLKKGAVATLEGLPEPGGMKLAALFPPRSLRKLGSR